jgi:general secretion pathway protein L
MAISPDFTPVRATPAWRQKLAAFWRWWAGEVSRLVPERFSMLRGAGRSPIVAIDGDDVTLVDARGVTGETRITLAPLDEPHRRSALRTLLERAGETRARARIALNHDEALSRRVTMPGATEENLSQVLAFEMDRLTPFKAEDVYFDHRVISRDAVTGQLLVQIAVASRDLVDARVAKLRSLGASVQGVGVRDDVGHAGPPLDLLPTEQRGERESSRERLVQRGLLAAIALLLVVALLLPVWQKRETIIALHPLLAKAKQEAEATDAIARELEKQVSDYNFLLARKHGAYPVLAFVEEMSRLLADNTWVQQFEVKTVGKAREVQITGETPSSSKLIEILEQSALLQNAATRGPVTRGSQPGMERFMIAAEARARAQPESRPVMEVASAIPTPVPQAPAAAPPATAPATPAPATATVTPAPPPAAPESALPKGPGSKPSPPPKAATPSGK